MGCSSFFFGKLCEKLKLFMTKFFKSYQLDPHLNLSLKDLSKKVLFYTLFKFHIQKWAKQGHFYKFRVQKDQNR